MGETKIVARQKAIEVAKSEIISKIETNILRLVENSIANQQLDQNTALALTQILTANKQMINKKLGNAISFFEAYKEIGNDAESFVIVGYESQKVLTIARETLKSSLDEKEEDFPFGVQDDVF